MVCPRTNNSKTCYDDSLPCRKEEACVKMKEDYAGNIGTKCDIIMIANLNLFSDLHLLILISTQSQCSISREMIHQR